MTIFDYMVFLIIAASMLLGLMRGLVREVFALLAWVIAFVAARTFAVHVVAYMPASIETPSLRMLAAFVTTFVVALILAMIASSLLSALLKRAGLGAADRGLGAVFGLLRGTAIVLVIVLVGGMTALPREPSWRDAASAQWFESVALGLKPWLPQELAKRIQFPPRQLQSWNASVAIVHAGKG